jgi:hypothetical protein
MVDLYVCIQEEKTDVEEEIFEIDQSIQFFRNKKLIYFGYRLIRYININEYDCNFFLINN